MARLSKEEQQVGGVILALMLLVGATITIARSWFPYFLIGSVVLLVALVIVGLTEYFARDHTYLDIWEYLSTYLGIGLVLFLIGTGITYEIGYGLGDTTFGQASLGVYNAVTGAEQALQDSINEVVEESCNSLPEASCVQLRTFAKTAQTLQEVADLADQLRTASAIVS